MKTYYKVVRRDGERLLSSIMGEERGTGYFQRIYTAAHWTHGVRRTPVMAFESLREAHRFAEARWRGGHEIWIAEVRSPRRLNRVPAIFAGRAKLLGFWELLQRKKQWWRLPPILNGSHPGMAPDGTVACEAIRLVKKL